MFKCILGVGFNANSSLLHTAVPATIPSNFHLFSTSNKYGYLVVHHSIINKRAFSIGSNKCYILNRTMHNHIPLNLSYEMILYITANVIDCAIFFSEYWLFLIFKYLQQHQLLNLHFQMTTSCYISMSQCLILP